MLRGTAAWRTFAFALAVSFSSVSTGALAQERDAAAAQALFDQAGDLMKQGKFAEACPKLQESNRLDPGIGTQFHLADCYEQSGRVASAWAAFLDVASQARASSQADREKAATARAEKLQPRLPRLVVNVPERSKTPGLEVRRNGMLVGSAQWGSAVPVDPGEVELTASAPGKQTLRQTLRLEEGKTANYSVPALGQDEAAATAMTPAPAASPPASSVAAAPLTETQPAPTTSDTATTHKNMPLVWTLAGAGVVGLGVSATFAVIAKGKNSDSKKQCNPSQPNLCSDTGVGLRNDAIRSGNVATVAVIAGGVALAGAAVVWLLSGSSEEKHADSHVALTASADFGAEHGTLLLQGSF